MLPLLEAGLSGKERYNILVVDDEKSMRDFLELMLYKEGYHVSLASDGQEALDVIDKEDFDLIITDIRMRNINGIDVLKRAKDKNPNIPVIMISAYATAETAVEAMKEGAYDYIPKPFRIGEFKKIIKDALKTKKAPPDKKDEHRVQVHFGCLIGESPQMKKVYDLIERAAPTKTNVLISGESGTGKELVARAIHQQSPRKDKPFVVINCAGIPETLIESELFGYKKGAFTGASSDRLGLFDVADGGTVFFDEIGELPPIIQVKLLRVIQEKTFKAVGSTEERSVDVRFISATNKDLEKEVINNRFREDLYFRLNVIHIELPPLRERKGDLKLLVNYFINKYSKELNKDVRKISAYAMDILGNYSFPGNVRELENIIERSVALESSNIILPESLTLSNFKKQEQEKRYFQLDLPADGINLDEIMEEIEKSYILKALNMASNSRQKASELLGISQRSLRYRMEKLNIIIDE